MYNVQIFIINTDYSIVFLIVRFEMNFTWYKKKEQSQLQ